MLRAFGRAAGLVLALATSGAQCGGTQNPETPAPTIEGRAIQSADRLLRSTGVTVDRAKIDLEPKLRAEISSDLDAQLGLGLRPEQLKMLWQLRGILEATPAIRSLEGLRRKAVEAQLPGVRVYYVATRRAIVFVDADQQDPKSLEVATAGQLVYAFYDQGPGGLADALYEPQGHLDEIRVRICLLEGHARLAELLLRHGKIDHLDPETLAGFDVAPTSLHASLSDGLCGAGARYLYSRYREGGWAEVLRAVRNPPASTEQLMHPVKVGQDFPVNVPLPDWPIDDYDDPDPLGTAEEIYEDVLGELTIYRLLLERGVEPTEALRAVVGWDGDRLRVYRHESGEKVTIWRSAWDRDIDAEQFAAAIAPKGIEPRAFRVERHGRVVDAVSTSRPEMAIKLHAALTKRTGEPAAQPADAASTAAIEGRLGG